jgi:hypothetical protein
MKTESVPMCPQDAPVRIQVHSVYFLISYYFKLNF